MTTELLQENYEFNAPPKVVQKNRYRELPADTCNIMWDKRVIRGNTYSSSINNKPEEMIKTTIRKQRVQQNTSDKQEDEKVLTTETQTDPNVESLTDKPPRHQKDTQTEFVIEKIIERMYMKQKTGTDVETQVWDDGELFNFEYEVEPILSVLVQKTLELSRMEVLQEEELREMRQQQAHYTQLKQAEMAEQERLEKKEQQLYNENIRLKQQFHHQKQRDIKSHEKLICRVISKQFLQKVQSITIKELDAAGFFSDTVVVDLTEQLLPWIYENVALDLISIEQLEQQMEDILNNVDNNVINKHKKVVQDEFKRREDIQTERERQRIAKQEADAERRERRKKRLERERRQKIREQIQEALVSKGEERESLQLISDIDGFQQGTPTIGFLGGIHGEIIILINALKALGHTVDINDLVHSIITALPDTTVIEVGFNEAVLIALQEIDPELNLQTLPEEVPQGLYQILTSNIQFSIQPYLHSLGFVPEILEAINKVIITMRPPKIRFVKCKEQTNFQKVPALVRIIPNLEHLPFHPKSGKQRPERIADEESIEEEVGPLNLGEALVENKATAFNVQSEEISTLVLHSVSEMHLRQLALAQLGEGECQPLVDLIEKCTEIQNHILEEIRNDLPLLEVHQY